MGYRFLRFPEGRGKAVTLSYDDGCVYDVKLAEIIDRYRLKCTFNLNSKSLLSNANGSRVTLEQARGFLLSGHEIAVHGEKHKAPGLVSPLEGIRDVLYCREALEQTFGRIIRGMAYPDSGITRFVSGHKYEDVRNYLKDLGIAYSRTLGQDNDKFELPTDWYAWMPTAHHVNPLLDEYMNEFLAIDPDSGYTARRYPRLFYLWGHSYEFNNQNNWELLEHIGETLGGKDDIWYATNIEIYEYVTAYNSLIWSADGKQVYNPTLLSLWFAQDDRLYCITSGETLLME